MSINPHVNLSRTRILFSHNFEFFQSHQLLLIFLQYSFRFSSLIILPCQLVLNFLKSLQQRIIFSSLSLFNLLNFNLPLNHYRVVIINFQIWLLYLRRNNYHIGSVQIITFCLTINLNWQGPPLEVNSFDLSLLWLTFLELWFVFQSICQLKLLHQSYFFVESFQSLVLFFQFLTLDLMNLRVSWKSRQIAKKIKTWRRVNLWLLVEDQLRPENSNLNSLHLLETHKMFGSRQQHQEFFSSQEVSQNARQFSVVGHFKKKKVLPDARSKCVGKSQVVARFSHQIIITRQRLLLFYSFLPKNRSIACHNENLMSDKEVKGSQTAVQRVVAIKSIHVEIGSTLRYFRNRLFRGVSNFWLGLFFFLRLLKLLSIIIFFMLLSNMQLLLYLSDKSSDLFLGNLVLSQNMRVLSVELLSRFIRVRMQHQFLKQNGIHFFLGV